MVEQEATHTTLLSMLFVPLKQPLESARRTNDSRRDLGPLPQGHGKVFGGEFSPSSKFLSLPCDVPLGLFVRHVSDIIKHC
jgi:hypothetical protein